MQIFKYLTTYFSTCFFHGLSSMCTKFSGAHFFCIVYVKRISEPLTNSIRVLLVYSTISLLNIETSQSNINYKFSFKVWMKFTNLYPCLIQQKIWIRYQKHCSGSRQLPLQDGGASVKRNRWSEPPGCPGFVPRGNFRTVV